MAATPKHRRSSSKKKSTRASNRYDVALNKFRRIKKYGGSTTTVSKETGIATPKHTVSKDNPFHKGIKIISTAEDTNK